MSGFTRLSCMIWEWPRWNQLGAAARILWLALYTSPNAKRGVPALWHGSVLTMAEAARLPLEEAYHALDTLLDRELAEYDPKTFVLRLTELPDAGEWPSSNFILESWYKRFLMVPECGVRDAHVPTIRWILERGAREASKNRRGVPSVRHETTWAETFGTIPVPAPRKRGLRRLADNTDTGNEVQPSLFGSDSPLQIASPPGASLALPETLSVDNSDSLHQMNQIRYLETHSSGSGEGEGEGEGDLVSGRGEAGLGASTIGSLVDRLCGVLGSVLGGSWSPPAAPQRAIVEAELERFTEADYALLADWMRGSGVRVQAAQHLLYEPGAVTKAMQTAHRWHDGCRENARRAAAASAELRRGLAAAGLTNMIGASGG